MKDFIHLKQENNLTTFHFVLLSIFTLDLYELLWIYKTNKTISNKTKIVVTGTQYPIIFL
ncbi:hypothetical protein GCM10023211_05750 [Orbus sasakiae]|uniref:Uncharacterized protein n=1 Tax=Orbus sasakiae TaxID=1078475 RepID=A0ABP9N2S0_9GAMM